MLAVDTTPVIDKSKIRVNESSDRQKKVVACLGELKVISVNQVGREGIEIASKRGGDSLPKLTVVLAP